MNTIIFLLLLIKLIFTVNYVCGQDLSEDDIPSPNITCYRCTNRHISKPKCEKAPAHGVAEGEVEEVISVEPGQCMTVNDFLAENDLITQKWMKMNFKNFKERSKSRSGDAQSISGTDDNTLQAFCVTLVIFTEEFQATPHIYRDCIRGYPERIKRNFVNNFDYNGTQDEFVMPEKGGKRCNRKQVGIGFHRVNVCLCQSEKCNDANALMKISGCEGVMMKSSIYSFIFSFLFIPLYNSHIN